MAIDTAQLEAWKKKKKLSGFAIDPESGNAALEAHAMQTLAGFGAGGLIDMVRELAKNAGLAEPPLIFISDSGTLEASGSALSENKYIFAIDKLMLADTTPAELRGIISHELAHIALGHAVYDDPQESSTRLTRLLDSKLGKRLRAPLQLWLARFSEKAADEASVIIAGSSDGLVSYLTRIGEAPTALGRIKDKLETPFSDHPRFEKRIDLLKKFDAAHHTEITATHSRLDHWRGRLTGDFSQAVALPSSAPSAPAVPLKLSVKAPKP